MEFKNKQISKFVDGFMKSDASKGRRINYDRIAEVDAVLTKVLEIFGDHNKDRMVHIHLRMFKPLYNMATISVVGDPIVFEGGDWVKDVFGVADNMEVDPLTSGEVEMQLGFYGVSSVDKKQDGGANNA